jgi:hypothetical protein
MMLVLTILLDFSNYVLNFSCMDSVHNDHENFCLALKYLYECFLLVPVIHPNFCVFYSFIIYGLHKIGNHNYGTV